MRVETMSHPTTVHLRFTDLCGGVLEQHMGAGRYEPVAVTDKAADADIPGMGGGYSKRNGRVFDVSDPYTYDVLRLRRGNAVYTELSLEDIDKLAVDADGRRIVPVTCTTASI